MNVTTAPQRGIFASVATIRTLTKLLVGSVALLFAITASAQPTLGPWTWTNVKLNDATTGDPSGTVTGSFTVVPSGPFFTLTGSTTTTGADGTTFDSGTVGPGGFILLRSADGPDYTGAPMFVLETFEPAVPGGRTFETTVFDLDATPSDGSADIAFSVSEGTVRITGAFQITCSNADCNEVTVGDVVDYDSVPPPTIVGPAITNFQYSLNGGAYTALSPANAVSPITIPGLTNGTAYSITLKAINSAGESSAASAPVVTTPVPPPDAPDAPTATAGNSQASVTWTKPNNGGSTITSYTATSAPEDKTCTTSGADSLTCDVTGLDNGTPYAFTVTATNASGTSGASAASNSVTPLGAPDAPTGLLQQGEADNVATIAFTPGEDNGAAIINYAYSLDGGPYIALDPAQPNSPVTITGLTNGTTYSITLKAINSVGDSVASASVAVTLRWAVDCSQNSYIFTTQAQVDAVLQDCDSVVGGLTVENSTDITNLDGLAKLNSVGDELYIGNNAALTNIDGLAKLNSVGGYLQIYNNDVLTNLDGLAVLASVGDFLYIGNNADLANIEGLAKLNSVGGSLAIYSNDSLTNLYGPANLTSVGDSLEIENNQSLTNLDGLALTSVGGSLEIENNQSLTNIEGLAKLNSVGGSLYIDNNTALTNIDGLAKLNSVGGSLAIYGNDALTNLDGLAKLNSVGRDLYIGGNADLANIDGLAKLASVGGDLEIENNQSLTNLDGLANLTSVGELFANIGTLRGYLQIYNNDVLTNCQGIAPVLGWPSGPPDDSVGGEITIESNATGCNSVEEILASYSPPAATPVPTSPLWLLGIMAGLLSLVGIRKLRKA